MRNVPPDFGCCALPAVTDAASATANKLRSLFVSPSQVGWAGSSTALLLFLDAHAKRSNEAGQPGRRAEGCGVNSPGLPEWQPFVTAACQGRGFRPHHWAKETSGKRREREFDRC